MHSASIFALLALAAPLIPTASAHYANMGLDNVSCYLLNGVKGTPEGDLVVVNKNGTWYDHDDVSRSGTVTVVHNQTDYDNLDTHPKIGIICAPDDLDWFGLGITYEEMEPSDEEFYSDKQTVYEMRTAYGQSKPSLTCIIKICRNNK